MSELRHSRPMIRHHRQRIIKKRDKLFSWLYNWKVSKKGQLSKWSNHHHEDMCRVRYKRQRYNWKQDLENGP